LFGKLSCEEKKKMLAMMASGLFFFSQERLQTEHFCHRMVKNGQLQHKDMPHTQEKSQGAATSVEDAIAILRGLNLCGAHCMQEVMDKCVCSVCMYIYKSMYIYIYPYTQYMCVFK
jgi:hypothetical protein